MKSAELKYAIDWCVLVCVPDAFADIITVPSGLNPGDQYRLAFVTSGIRNATSSNLADYNNFVNDHANASPALAALQTIWKAIGSTAAIDARDNTGTNPSSLGVPVYRLDGLLIANKNVDLWDSTLINPLSINEMGVGNPGVENYIWTGSSPDGIEFIFGSNSYALGSSNVSLGLPLLGNSWMHSVNLGSSYLAHIYAMSDSLTVVPEPNSSLLVGMAGLGFVVRKRSFTRSFFRE